MNESKTNRPPFYPALGAVLLLFLFLICGRDSWHRHEVVVSVGLKSAIPQTCQVFWTEDADAPFVQEQSASVLVHCLGVSATLSLPAANVEKLRFDFGDGLAPMRAGPIRVSGIGERILDWNDFSVLHDIARFDIDGKGAVDVVASGGDPCAIVARPLGIRGKTHINWFVVFCRILLAAIFWWPLAGPRGVLRDANPRAREEICTMSFLVLAALLVAARFALTARIPPFFAASKWDSYWFARMAASLADGRWLGPYDQYTLCKGCFGPMVAAAAMWIGVPFPVAETVLYVLGCLFFLFVFSHLCRNRPLLLASLAFLLFQPLSYSIFSWQYVYRNGMALWQVPLAFGSLFLLFRSSGGPVRRFLPWTFVSGLALWMLLNTREDGMWIWPFVLVCTAASAIRAWGGGGTRKRKAARALLSLLPLAVVLGGNAVLCLVNWRIYGMPLRNDRDSGNYAKAMRDLYLIEPDPADEARLSSAEHAGHYHNIYYSTLARAYDESPTLNAARQSIDELVDMWAKAHKHPGRDLVQDQMLFAIRDGAARAGVYGSLPESEAFFGRVHAELSEAFAQGRLRRRGFPLTSLTAPLQAKHVSAVLREWPCAIGSALSPHDAVAYLPDKALRVGLPAFPSQVPLFERVSGCGAPDRYDVCNNRPHVQWANAAGAFYGVIFPWTFGLAATVYILLSALLAFRRTRATRILDGWLFATGLLGSILVHTGCIACVTATTFRAMSSQYLAASSQLAMLFVVIVAGLAWQMARPSEAERK